MITSLRLKNYKAFEDVEIPIKPITILLGANSVGKSSIIQFLLMLQQTGKTGIRSYKSALKLYGGYVNLGDPQNLFRKKDTSKPLSFSFNIKSKRLKSFLSTELLDQFLRVFIEIPIFLPFKGLADIKHQELKNVKDFSRRLDILIEFLNKESTKEQFSEEVRYFLHQRYDMKIPELNKQNKKQVLDIYTFLSSLKKEIKNENFKVEYQLEINSENNLAIQSYSIFHNDKLIIGFNNSNELKFSSDLIELNQLESEEIQKIFNPNNTIFNSILRHDIDSITLLKSSVLVKILDLFQKELGDEFGERNINYVSPLRAHPKRYYMLDKAKMNLTLDTLDGDAIAEVLKDNQTITRKVNTWLNKFGIEVNVKEFKEVIHHLVVKQNELDLDITDVGFGISQILPVIIQGFLSRSSSTTIIEQPEIHLHPKIQADLADLFIDITKISRSRKLIIETHSEYILKRLRRRISEEKISSKDVAICLFEPQKNGNGGKIKVLNIEEKGFFEWPEEFYGGELYNDTAQFLINQN